MSRLLGGFPRWEQPTRSAYHICVAFGYLNVRKMLQRTSNIGNKPEQSAIMAMAPKTSTGLHGHSAMSQPYSTRTCSSYPLYSMNGALTSI
jgi:hypothetical protein